MRLAVACAVLAATRLAAADVIDRDSARSARLDLTGKVAEIPGGYGYCGVLAVWGVIRYEVVAVHRGHFADRDAFVVVLCPEAYKVGMTHRLVLEPATRHNYFDKLGGAAPRYRATKVSPG